jgi:VLRF1 release factor-like protein
VWLDVDPARFPGWIASFARRHDAGLPDASLAVALAGDGVSFTAPDGAVADCHPPFPPVRELMVPLPAYPDVAGAIAAHAQRPRTVGVLLVRLGGYAAGVFTGSPPLLADAKTGSRPVHGRSAAGGRSQHRFARRREKQANEALAAAANTAVDVFGRWGEKPDRSENLITARGGDAAAARRSRLDAVVLGGDKRAVAELRGDPRLAPYLAIATDRFLTVPDPRRRVLEDAPRLFLAVKIRLTEPAP